MSRNLKGGTVDDLADQGTFDVALQGMRLLRGAVGERGFVKGISGGLGSLMKGPTAAHKEDNEYNDDEDDSESDYADDEELADEESSDYDDDELQENEAKDFVETYDDDGDNEGFFSAFDNAGKSALSFLGMNKKTFVCEIYKLKVTNIARRRRDVQVIMTLGAPSDVPGLGGLVGDGGPQVGAQGGELSAAAEGGASVDGSGGRLKRSRRWGRQHRAVNAGSSKVAVKLEHGKTAHLKRTFHGKWHGTYEDLSHRDLHLLLVEQTRFGNLIEIGTASIPLIEVASGSVQQEVMFTERDGRTTIDSYRCHFHIHFQERFTFVLRFVEWKGYNLRASDDTGTSDPFLKFSIRSKGHRNYRHFLKKGVIFGRKALTEVQYNTLFPSFSEAKQPIYYRGTRSDLENENLRIEVWDWDQASRNDLIGFAEVPLRGVLLSGRISTSLAIQDTSAPRSKQKKRDDLAGDADDAALTQRLIHAGTLEGAIELMAEPAHTQFGDIVKRQPKMTYLALEIVKATDLAGKKPDGTSDAYVTAVWASTSQQTRVVRSTRSPTYDEILYFPTNLVRITAADVEAKGDITIYVLHHSITAPEDIGFARITLDRITAAPIHKVDDGDIARKTRLYEATLPLSQPGLKRGGRGEIKVRAYFTPDLPSDIIIAPRKLGANELESSFKQREVEWTAQIPYRLFASGRYQVSALDETNVRHFLPTYLAKCAPPRDVHDPMHIARMVHSITFQLDAHLRAKGAAKTSSLEEVWSSPNYFLDVKKGASEDHAILQCNLFLGLGLDAYLAIGKLPGGVTQHVWVVTREPNGDVRFWETTKGSFYCLPGRWAGLYLDGATEGILQAESASDTDQSGNGGATRTGGVRSSSRPGTALATREERRSARAAMALAADKAAREAQRKEKEQAEQRKKEAAMLFLASEEMILAETEPNPYETPRDWDQQHAHPLHALESEANMHSASHMKMKQAGTAVMNMMTFSEAAKSAALAARGDARTPTSGQIHGLQGERSGSRAGRLQNSAKIQLPELQLPSLHELLPYETIEVVFNHENLWANLQPHSIASCGFNLEDSDRWLPFIEEGVFEPPVPRPFYSVGRIGPKLPPQRLSALRLQIHRAVSAAYTSWRTTRTLRTRWLTKLEPLLNDGLATYEMAACSSMETDARAVDKWRGYLLSALPPDHSFVGRAFSFSVTTPELIVEYLMTKYEYHEQGHKDVSFALAVQCFPHYGAVASTWVFIGYLVPHLKLNKRKGDKAEED